MRIKKYANRIYSVGVGQELTKICIFTLYFLYKVLPVGLVLGANSPFLSFYFLIY